MRKTKDSISQETSSKIETNAKNEIKELLDEFVVQPIKSDLPSTFEGINDAIYGIRKETKLIKDSIPSIAYAINAQLKENTFIFEDKDTVFDSTKNEIVEAIKQQKNDVSTNLSEIAKSQQEFVSEKTTEITDKIGEAMRHQSSTDEVIKLLYEKVIYQQSLIEGQNKIINELAKTLADLNRVLEQLDNRISANKRDIRSLSNRFWKRK